MSRSLTPLSVSIAIAIIPHPIAHIPHPTSHIPQRYHITGTATRKLEVALTLSWRQTVGRIVIWLSSFDYVTLGSIRYTLDSSGTIRVEHLNEVIYLSNSTSGAPTLTAYYRRSDTVEVSDLSA